MKFKHDLIELQELIIESNKVIRSVRPGAIEKDYYVTHIIHALSDIQNDYFSLTFAGGTALAKAYKLVNRMSEDCDFRIQALPKASVLNKTQFRKALKDFRYEILSHLREYGFTILEENIKIRDAGNYMKIKVPYHAMSEQAHILRPHIQLEFIAINTKLPIERKEVTTLIRQILSDNVPHTVKNIECIAVSETAADKWVALTRRVANTLHREAKPTDDALIRHLFDLYYIDKHGYFNDLTHNLISQVIFEDSQRYKNHNIAYYDNPLQEIKLALSALYKDKTWQLRWDAFIEAMTFNNDGLNYNEALVALKQKSDLILLLLGKK